MCLVDREEYVERVLAVVEQIPAGRVMSYGSIAEVVGVGGPRQVGKVMSLEGGGVPWWRVVHADGTVWFLEVNVAPGLTETSTVPLSVQAAGLDLGELVETLVRGAVSRSTPN